MASGKRGVSSAGLCVVGVGVTCHTTVMTLDWKGVQSVPRGVSSAGLQVVGVGVNQGESVIKVVIFCVGWGWATGL